MIEDLLLLAFVAWLAFTGLSVASRIDVLLAFTGLWGIVFALFVLVEGGPDEVWWFAALPLGSSILLLYMGLLDPRYGMLGGD